MAREATPAEAGGPALDPPAAPGAIGPNLAVAEGDLVATWIETVAGERHRLRFSRLRDNEWSTPATVSEGDDFFVNWADFPEVVEMGDGALLAHWLAKTAPDTYAYSIFLARSDDGGESWGALGKLNDDNTPTEHGFVSFVSEPAGARAFWLDGRAMAEGGPMSLRTARIGREVGPAEVLDPRICECCSTDAAVTLSGPVVVYRDRSEQEVRDISRVRLDGDTWTAPRAVSADGWRIEGCPVNGPEVVAAGDLVATAWFTAAGEAPSVRLAFSPDGAGTFAPPITVDAERPMGRVDVALGDRDSVWVSWLGAQGEGGGALVRLREFGPEGPRGEALTVGATAAGRSSGVPRLVRLGRRLYLAYVEVGDGPSRVRLRSFGL